MDDSGFLLVFWAIIGAIVGGIIGDRKGRGGAGVVLGLLLGPIGWLIIALGPDYKTERESKKCPFCAELVKKEAKVCKHCGRDFPGADTHVDIPPLKARCPYCGKEVAENLEACPHCRMRIAHIWP